MIKPNRATDSTVSPRLRLLNLKQVCALMGIGKTMLYERMATGTFPKPIKIGSRTLWREATLIAYLDKLEQKAQKGER